MTNPGINAATMYGMMPNMYYNQVALNDLTDMNLSYPTSLTFDPMLSMQGSIFGGMNYGMMNPYMTNPYMPAFTGGMGNMQNYYQNYEQYQDFMINNRVRQQQKMRDADLQLNSPQEGIQKQAELLHDKILRNEQEQIKIAYDSFINSVQAMYPNRPHEEIENRAETLYKQLTGSNIFDDIRKNGRGSFEQGLLQTATFGLADGKTAEENISDLTGLPVGRMEQGKKMAGNVVGGTLVGGGVFAGIGLLLKCLKVGSKSKTFWGLLAGAAAGIFAAIKGSKS